MSKPCASCTSFSVPRSGQSLPWAPRDALVAAAAGWVPVLSPSLQGSFGKRGAVSPTTFQTGVSQLARGALCPLYPASSTLGWQDSHGRHGALPEQESGTRLFTSDSLPPTFFCSICQP